MAVFKEKAESVNGSQELPGFLLRALADVVAKLGVSGTRDTLSSLVVAGPTSSSKVITLKRDPVTGTYRA